jgi:SAM-dependent methyltransferase
MPGVIFTKDILFLHVPKTGGMSVSSYLLEVLPAPVYYVRPAHAREDFAEREGVVRVAGGRHQSLPAAAEFLRDYGLELADFRLILAVLRNPYSLEVSRYHYLRQGHPQDGGPNQRLALTRDFTTFAAKSSFKADRDSRPLENYLYLEGKLPPNLTIARFENLEADVKGALSSIGIEDGGSLPWRNVSRHGDFASYYTKEAEEAVYRKYGWVFEAGFYERMPQLGRDAKGQRPPGRAVYTLPIVGPVRQREEASGFHADCWVARTLRCTLVPDELISEVILEGRVPRIPDARDVTLTFSVDGEETAAMFRSGQRFSWTVPCTLVPGAETELTLKSSAIRRPEAARDSRDGRDLALRLDRITFLTTERLMKRDWDRRAVENAMHYVNPARSQWDTDAFFESGRRDTEEHVVRDLEAICRGRDPKSMRALEIGCGVGRMTKYLAEVFGEVRGIDVSREMMLRARANLADRANVLVFEAPGADLGHFIDHRFDFCFSFRTFQRIPTREAVVSYFREVHRTLKPGRLFKFQVQGVSPAVPDTWDGVGFSEDELRELADTIGFEVVRMEGSGTEHFWNWWARK